MSPLSGKPEQVGLEEALGPLDERGAGALAARVELDRPGGRGSWQMTAASSTTLHGAGAPDGPRDRIDDHLDARVRDDLQAVEPHGPCADLGPPCWAPRKRPVPGAPPGRPRSSPSGKRRPRPGRAGTPRPRRRAEAGDLSSAPLPKAVSRIILPDSVTTAPPPSSVGDTSGKMSSVVLMRLGTPRAGAPGPDAVAPPDAPGPACKQLQAGLTRPSGSPRWPDRSRRFPCSPARRLRPPRRAGRACRWSPRSAPARGRRRWRRGRCPGTSGREPQVAGSLGSPWPDQVRR